MQGNHRCNHDPLDTIPNSFPARPPVHFCRFGQMLFLQSIMVAARQFGLETCPQAAFLVFYDVLQRRLGIPAEQQIVCGMSLGYPDGTAKVNAFTPERMPAEDFVTFVDRLQT